MNPHQVLHFVSTSLLLVAILLASCQSQKEQDGAQALQRLNDSLRSMIDSMRKEFAEALNAAFRSDSVSQFRITSVRQHTVSVKILDGG
jgi:hypothetical protein